MAHGRQRSSLSVAMELRRPCRAGAPSRSVSFKPQEPPVMSAALLVRLRPRHIAKRPRGSPMARTVRNG